MRHVNEIEGQLCSISYNSELSGVRIARMLEQDNIGFFQNEYLEYLFEMEKAGDGFRRGGGSGYPAELDYGLMRQVSQYIMQLAMEDRELIAKRVNEHMVGSVHPGKSQGETGEGDRERFQGTGAPGEFDDCGDRK